MERKIESFQVEPLLEKDCVSKEEARGRKGEKRRREERLFGLSTSLLRTLHR